MIITISGPAGSGKGTIGRIIARRLGFKTYSGGDFRRIRAKELGMTIEEYNKYGENDPKTDIEADEWQKNLGLKEDNFIIDSRLGFHFIPHSVKIFITASDEVAAHRIFNDKGPRINQLKVGSIEEQKRLSVERNESDKLRYRKHYGLNDFTAKENFDLIIDTTHEHDAEKNAQKIIDYLLEKKLITNSQLNS